MSEEKEIYFRSIGLMRGVYLPSNEEKQIGTFLTEQGIFPAELEEPVIKFFDRDIERKKRKGKSGRPAIAKEHDFVCWVSGIEQFPHYKFYLRGRIGQEQRKMKTKINELLPENNFFVTRGIVVKRDPGEVIQRIQKNNQATRTDQEIAESANNLKIVDCPGKVRNNQFWEFRSTLYDGLLHCQSAELLAYAKDAKKLLA